MDTKQDLLDLIELIDIIDLNINRKIKNIEDTRTAFKNAKDKLSILEDKYCDNWEPL